jgi:hypothetical protein
MPQMPTLPTSMDRQPVELLGALRDASETAGTDVIRYAVNCLQLRGNTGQVVATDGRQMLSQSGYTFAWDDAVLIPASPVFGCRELSGQEPVALGRTDQCVTLTIGGMDAAPHDREECALPKRRQLCSVEAGMPARCCNSIPATRNSCSATWTRCRARKTTTRR